MPQRQEDLSEVMKAMMDIVSVSTLVAYVVGALPVIATSLTIVWTAIRIWETPTFQAWWAKGKGPVRGPLD
jgi:hypothetical protein